MKFNPVFIKGTTLGDTWFQLLQGLYDNGREYLITEGSYKGINRLVFDDVAGFISYPHTRPLAPIMPEGSNLPAPTTDHDIEMYFADYLMNSNIQDNEDYKYATFITGGKYQIPKCSLGFKDYKNGLKINVPNQLEWIINHFKTKGFGNEHGWLTIGYPESNFAYDIPYTTEIDRKTSPCLKGLDFRIIQTDEGNFLHTKVVYRSWDLWSGFPTNMGGFTLLNEYVAGELGNEPGPLSFTCKSLHAYQFQLEVIKLRLGKTNNKI